MEAKQAIIAGLEKVLADLGFSMGDFSLELNHPKDEAHGDYSSNIAMAIFTKFKNQNEKGKKTIQKAKFKSPFGLAQEVAKVLNTHPLILNTCSRITAAEPGFINFYLSKEFLSQNLQNVLDLLEQYGKSEILKDKKIMVEFTDPNPFKEFHIGHLYSNVVGEALCRLLESQGAQVWRVTYQGDVGLHVAKAIYGIMKQESGIMDESLSLNQRIKLLGQAYALGSKAYEESESAKQTINEINKKVYEQDPEIMPVYEKGKQWSLDYFEEIYNRLGTAFVKNYFESVAGPVGLALVKDHIKRGVFKESEGAVIFEGEKYGLHNRVFINSLGLPTYEAKDMGLPPTKYKDFPYDESIIITAQEQSGYFEVVLKALSFVNPDLASKTHHIAHGMVRLPEGKMSSRTGNVLTGEWLLDEAKAQIQRAYKEMDAQTAEQVAIGAVKYALLKSSIGKDTAFDFDESISLEGNSGPYLQYTYARTRSVLTKAGAKSVIADSLPEAAGSLQAGDPQSRPVKNGMLNQVQHDKMEVEELALLRAINRFPEVLEEAAAAFAPNMLCTYLFDLAQKFNLFYQKHQILGAVWEIRDFRLSLTGAVGHVLKNGLYFLGIQAPEKM